jgi:hypothetical protein
LIVTLLTDFGLADHYVAAIKGRILSRDPRIVTVDISHEVPKHDIRAAAFLLSSCYRDFPPGTVHLAVVDPGVGSPRRPLAIAAEGYFFVGPDNGLFGDVWRRATDREVREIDATNVEMGPPSSTFHGRDIFAPAAAALATGVPLAYLGPVAPSVAMFEAPVNSTLEGGVIEGRVVHVDRFGNCITSLSAGDFPDGNPGHYQFRIGEVAITRTRSFYGEEDGDEPFIILGSSGPRRRN